MSVSLHADDEHEYGAKATEQGIKSSRTHDRALRTDQLSIPGAMHRESGASQASLSVALGSEAWVESVFERNRERLKVKRERGARAIKAAGLKDLRGLVDLRGELG